MTGLLDAAGVWCDVRPGRAPTQDGGSGGGARPALFLDRDGTLIEHVHYLRLAGDVRPIADAVAAVQAANAAGWAVVVVTNQSGVGRGYFGWEDVAAVQDRLYELLGAAGAVVDAAYACGHAPPDAGGPARSGFRKPAPGMLLRARDDLDLDLGRSWIAGDGAHDLAAGRAAGLCGGILVPTGYGARPDERDGALALAGDGFEVAIGGFEALPFLQSAVPVSGAAPR
ncbi:MAG: HAD-IIIA family hydrolase [Rhodospirillaceae bacterium]